jgi:glycosyltransferase involved in cell wall biosynthesis
LRIAYLCSDPGVPVCGNKGASIHVREFARSLRRLGHEVTVLVARAGGDAPQGCDMPIVVLETEPLDEKLFALLRTDPSAGIAVAGSVRSTLAAASLRQRALSFLHEFEPDLIYERYALFGTAGIAVARELGVPLILEVNAPLSDEHEQHRGLAYPETARELERMVLRSADHVVAVSSALANWLVAAGIAPERVTLLPNAVDPTRFEAARVKCEAVRNRLGLAEEPVVGFLGTLRPWHDVATLVRAIAFLRRRTPAPHLLVVGDGPERERLEELARSEGIAEATTFTGAVPHDGVASYVSVFDVAVVPYRRMRGFYFSPLKLFEYLAAGRPIVAADVGDMGHCIRHGETGLLYSPGDTEALAEAISDLLRDRARASSLGEAGREHVRRHHTWERNARLVLELAGQVLSRKPVGVPA